MPIDLHTHIVPEGWEDWASRYGGGNWPVASVAAAGLDPPARAAIEGESAARFLGESSAC